MAKPNYDDIDEKIVDILEASSPVSSAYLVERLMDDLLLLSKELIDDGCYSSSTSPSKILQRRLQYMKLKGFVAFGRKSKLWRLVLVKEVV